MIVEINENIIDVQKIESISPICNTPASINFTIYMISGNSISLVFYKPDYDEIVVKNKKSREYYENTQPVIDMLNKVRELRFKVAKLMLPYETIFTNPKYKDILKLNLD